MSEEPVENAHSDAEVEPPVFVMPPAFAAEAAPPPVPKPTLDWRSLAIALAIIWGIGFALQFALGIVLGVYSVLAETSLETLLTRAEFLVPVVLLGNLVAVSVGWYFACRRTGMSLAEGLGIRAVPLHAILLGFAIGIVPALFMQVLPDSGGAENTMMYKLLMVESEDGGEPRPSFVMLAFALIVPPLEELYYRGFLFTAFRRLTNVFSAILVIVVWFMLVHAMQLAGMWFLILWIGFMGLLWTGLRQRYDSILPGLAAHWSYNGTLVGGAFLSWALR